MGRMTFSSSKRFWIIKSPDLINILFLSLVLGWASLSLYFFTQNLPAAEALQSIQHFLPNLVSHIFQRKRERERERKRERDRERKNSKSLQNSIIVMKT